MKIQTRCGLWIRESDRLKCTRPGEPKKSDTRLFRRTVSVLLLNDPFQTAPKKTNEGRGGLCGANGGRQYSQPFWLPQSRLQTCKIELDSCGASIQIRCWTGNKAERTPLGRGQLISCHGRQGVYREEGVVRLVLLLRRRNRRKRKAGTVSRHTCTTTCCKFLL